MKAGIYNPNIPLRAGYLNQELKRKKVDNQMRKNDRLAASQYVSTYLELTFIFKNI